ncbi:PREDICTED: protein DETOXIFICATION 49-like [Prunus mume]|uniref:Protein DETOXIFICATION n=1 Tax=Prunus mume TaxID=102107 RepID=A0ABM0PMT0_PRUMU|nr:PREDICTED: protein DETOXIFICATION 49-like [Prunus mume]
MSYNNANAASWLYIPILSNLFYTTVKDDEEGGQDSQHRQPTAVSVVVQEIKQLYTIALPMILAGLLVYAKAAISMFFLGGLGKGALAGGSLAISVANISGYSVLSGLASGMEGISSQAFGAQQWPLMSHTLQRTVTILILISIPISIMWLNCESFLLFSGQNPTISSTATTYLTFTIPTLFFQSLINPLKIHLRTQQVTLPLMLSAALALAIHAPANYLLACHFHHGSRGVALAGVLTDLIILLYLILYLRGSGIYTNTWQVWSLHFCFKDWKPIICQAIPSCFSVCLEWWWYEIMIILSGLLSNAAEAMSTMGILIQATAFAYQFPFALSQAVSTRVGNELGANRPKQAKKSSFVALSCAVLTGLLSTTFMVTMRNTWGPIFTADRAIISLTASALPIVGLCELGNCPQTTVCGVLRGSARPTLGAAINLGSFYVVGLPVSLFMAFVMDLGLLGLWLGLLAAQLVCFALMVIVLIKTDWTAQAERSKELTSANVEEYLEDEANEGLISAIMLIN